MIGILDYGAGNVNAFKRIYDNLNVPNRLIKTENDFKDVSKLILPGVGAFDAVISKLNDSGLRDSLDDLVINKKMPVLGVCVGLQIMANFSEEGVLPGLSWIDAEVKKFNISKNFYVPHMGWNTASFKSKEPLFEGVDHKFGFYFVHSYYFENYDKLDFQASTFYGHDFISVIKKDNIIATQFHPEKSHENGIKLLRNFQKLC